MMRVFFRPHPGKGRDVLSAFESWEIVIGLLTICVSAAVTFLGHGFSQWARRLSEFSRTVDSRLDKMHVENRHQWEKNEAKVTAMQKELRDFHVCFERRVTRLEAKTDEV